MKRIFIFLFVSLFVFMGMSAKASVKRDVTNIADRALGAEIAEEKQDTMYQISVLEAYKQGYYNNKENKVSVQKNYGDFGIGFLKNETGALIFLDKKYYRSKDFKFDELKDKEYIPISFGLFKYFDEDDRISVKHIKDINELNQTLDKKLSTLNYFVALKGKGHFDSVVLQLLDGETKTINNAKGTIIGFRMPDYYKAVAPEGYIYYFVSDDKLIAAFVKDISIEIAAFSADYTNRMEIILPKNQSFKVRDFAQYNPKIEDKKAKKTQPGMLRDRQQMMEAPKGEPTPDQMMQMFMPKATFQ